MTANDPALLLLVPGMGLLLCGLYGLLTLIDRIKPGFADRLEEIVFGRMP